MVAMQAPPGVIAGQTVKLLSGTTYTVDASGFLSVTNQIDVIGLQNMGFLQVIGRNNFAASVHWKTSNQERGMRVGGEKDARSPRHTGSRASPACALGARRLVDARVARPTVRAHRLSGRDA